MSGQKLPGSAALSRSHTKTENFDGFADLWEQTRSAWAWSCLFVLPFWLETVCRRLGCAGETHIVSVRRDGELIGVVPLALDGTSAAFLGSVEVCDYQDLISAPGRQRQVLEAVLEHLAGLGIRRLDLRALRPDALVMKALSAMESVPHTILAEEVSFETALPAGWEDYLLHLDGKQRHEVRRKLRRLESQVRFDYRCIEAPEQIDRAADTFVALFRRNRPDKAAFMTDAMEAYFRELLRHLAERGMARLCFLDLGDEPAAGMLCFDYQGTRYLYNCGYDERFESLSVGALGTVLSIRHAIQAGCGRYDFLKGAEAYKKRLGGKETELHRCTISI